MKDPVAAKAKLMALVGTFTLTPETIDGIGYLRASCDADISGLLEVATQGKSSALRNTGRPVLR